MPVTFSLIETQTLFDSIFQFLLELTNRILLDLGLESCIEHVWRDTILYLDSDDPIVIGRAYGRVDRDLLHDELLRR